MAVQNFQIQLLDHSIDSRWWKKLIALFLEEGHPFEIRCWNEEVEEIAMAAAFSDLVPKIEGFEASVTGKICPKMIGRLTALAEPQDKQNYNKMTPFFTIAILPRFRSEHYGTEVFLYDLTAEEAERVKEIVAPFGQSFRVDIDEAE